MPNSIQARGLFYAKTDTGVLLPRAYSNFTATSEVETEDIQGYPLNDVGELQTYGTTKISTTWTVTTTQMFMVGADIPELFYNLYSKKSTAAFTLPRYKSYTVSESDTVTLVGAATDPYLAITLVENNVHTPMVKVTPTVAAANEYSVATDTITFHESMTGKTVVIVSGVVIATGTDMVGGANANAEIISMEIHGAYRIGGVVRKIWFPQVVSAGGASVPIGSADEIEKEYRATIPTALGWSQPFVDYPAAI